MQQYKDYLQHICDFGRTKTDRTGTGTRSVFGYQMRFNLAHGFPLVTLKRTYVRAIVHELLWFLKGGTNSHDLEQHDVKIWADWKVPEDVYESIPMERHERAKLYAEKLGISLSDATRRLNIHTAEHGIEAADKLLDEAGIPAVNERLVTRAGELGPVYGKQWRSWPNYRGGTIDQIAEVIHLLKTKPFSRRIIVSAWNPADLPDESKPPHVNAAAGYMALSACHTMFQFMVEPMTTLERLDYFEKNRTRNEHLAELHGKLKEMFGKMDERLAGYDNGVDVSKDVDDTLKLADAILNAADIPTNRLSCQLYQRSADSTLGVPFNIASYALLTAMIAQVVGMAPGDFVHTFGDAHIYLNHFEQNGPFLTKLNAERAAAGEPLVKGTPDGEGVESLLKRSTLPLPQLLLNPNIKNIDDFTFDDIKIVGYQSHPVMKFPIAV